MKSKACLRCGKSFSLDGIRPDKAKEKNYCSISCRNTVIALGKKNRTKREKSQQEKKEEIVLTLNAVLFSWYGAAL